MHQIISAVRGHIVACVALFVALGGAVPAIASASCPTPTKPPHCWEAGIEPTSGECGTYLKDREEEEAAYVRCERELTEVHEKAERELREANEKYGREIQKIREQQVAEEKRQSEAKYAREHPTPPPVSPPDEAEHEIVLTLSLSESYSDVTNIIRDRSGHSAHHLKDKCRHTSPNQSLATCTGSWFTALHVSATTTTYVGTFYIDKRSGGDFFSFVGVKANVGCSERKSLKRCESKVHWETTT